MELNQTRFREVKTTTELVFVLDSKGLKAHHDNSMKLLKENGLEALTPQKALVLIDQNPGLKEQLKGKWFYLAGKGRSILGYFTFNEKGELFRGRGDPERTVYLWEGTNPLRLRVSTDDDGRSVRYCFLASSDEQPSEYAPVVVGIKTQTPPLPENILSLRI
jgi:hypothetical protein